MSDITAKVKLDYSGLIGGMKRFDDAMVGTQRRAIALASSFSRILSAIGGLAAVGASLKGALDLGGAKLSPRTQQHEFFPHLFQKCCFRLD